MSKKQKLKQAIDGVIVTLMDRIMHKVLVEDPFLTDAHRASKPLYAALVPDEIFKGSHFERRFVTPFGGVWERLAVAAAIAGIGKAEQGHAITGTVNAERLRRIQEILNRLEHPSAKEGRIKPDWDAELKYILAGKSEQKIPTTVVCDVYVESPDKSQRWAFEIKAPLPNSDQTKVSKEKMLKLYAMDKPQINGAFYALPYNPYGLNRSDYAWSFPARWFDMKNDAVVLIGNDFWDKIGGRGTYEVFITTINEAGREYKERIYREYLGIEPPVQE